MKLYDTLEPLFRTMIIFQTRYSYLQMLVPMLVSLLVEHMDRSRSLSFPSMQPTLVGYDTWVNFFSNRCLLDLQVDWPRWRQRWQSEKQDGSSYAPDLVNMANCENWSWNYGMLYKYDSCSQKYVSFRVKYSFNDTNKI